MKPCTRSINLGVFRMSKTALWSFRSHWFEKYLNWEIYINYLVILGNFDVGRASNLLMSPPCMINHRIARTCVGGAVLG